MGQIEWECTLGKGDSAVWRKTAGGCLECRLSTNCINYMDWNCLSEVYCWREIDSVRKCKLYLLNILLPSLQLALEMYFL